MSTATGKKDFGITLNQLTEGIMGRDLVKESNRLVEKWNRIGLLRGLEGDRKRVMARLLENQASHLLKEITSLGNGAGGLVGSGDIRGFSNVAFPIVRRVFGGLVANELVSIQPMSLPSGLLFYLDYTYGSNVGGDAVLGTGAEGTSSSETYMAGRSIYNNPVGKGVRSGSLGAGGQYDLAGSGYSLVHRVTSGSDLQVLASGSYQGTTAFVGAGKMVATGTDGRLLQFDPQITNLIEADTGRNALGQFEFMIFDMSKFPLALDTTNIKEFSVFSNAVSNSGLAVIPETIQGGKNILNVRRLNQVGTWDGATFTPNPLVDKNMANVAILTVCSGVWVSTGATSANINLTASYVINSALDVDGTDGSTLTIPSFESDFGTTPSPSIPEIDIKIESIAVTATSRKLRARWSPELAQDLNAFHSMDAEVELTQILSEQIALELDREILNDLLIQAAGANYYWSRAPGKFVNKTNGATVNMASSLATGPTFTGTVQEWYQTLVETIIDVANAIHRKTLRGSANFVVTSPEVSTIFESTVYYRADYTVDGNGQVSQPIGIGAEKIGTLSNRFTVYKDPYFPRNKILVGYKGGSYLETGYVYAPYVPLIVTPTIFAPEDFTPRKGVMTRYGKKMVRSDFYGTLTVMDMNII